MGQQVVSATPGFADNAPVGAGKINANFTELYARGLAGLGAAVAFAPGAGVIDPAIADFVAGLGSAGTGRINVTLTGNTSLQGLPAGVDGQFLVISVVAGNFRLTLLADNEGTTQKEILASHNIVGNLGDALTLYYDAGLDGGAGMWVAPLTISDPIAPTYASARLLSGVNTGDRLQVLGRTSQSDGGQGLFTWVAGGSTTINDGSQLTAPGGIWQRPDTTIQAQWYGIDPTGVAASDVALNLAIQDAIIQKKKLVIPTGLFKLNAPLLCYHSTAVFSTVQIEGQGTMAFADNVLPTSQVYTNNTILYANFNSLPAVIFNASRSCILRNIAIVGQNIAPTSLSVPSSVAANYVTVGCRDSRYSPYCGICIDPFCGVTPPDGGYAGFTYPFAGASSQGTSGLLLENVNIYQFVVGVMESPTAGSAQGDLFHSRNVTITSCRICYAFGQGQNRANVIEKGNCGRANCIFDGITYNTQNGTSPIVSQMQIGNTWSIFQFQANAPGRFDKIYAETTQCFGRFSSGNQPLIVRDSQFSFSNSSAAWLLPPLLLDCSGPVLFEGCSIAPSSAVMDALNFAGSKQVTFDTCIFHGCATTGILPCIGVTRGGTSGWAKLNNCFFDNAFGGSAIWHSDYAAGRAAFSNQNLNNALPGRFIGTYQTQRVYNGNLAYDLVPPVNYTPDAQVAGGSVSAMVLNATTLTFTLTNADNYLCEGDILTWQMLGQFGNATKYKVPAFKIPVGGISGSSVTANMLFDPAQYDTVANNVSTSVFVVAQFWAPTQPITCTTNGTTSLTAVSPVNALRPGDFLIGIGDNGRDIPTSNPVPRVKTTDGAGNVTISVAATGSHTGVGLAFAQLNPVPSVLPYSAGNTGATPAPNYTNGAVQSWVLSANTTWGAPTNAPAVIGQTLTLLVTANGVWTTAWNATYRNAPAWAASANTQKATAVFMWDGVGWQFIGGSAAFA